MLLHKDKMRYVINDEIRCYHLHGNVYFKNTVMNRVFNNVRN